MQSDSVLLFIFLFILKLNYSFSFWKKSKTTLEDYIIDVLFTNSITIIRCNSYERHVIRDITIGKIGAIKCSNKDLFLPENHIESITLLQWNFTDVKCKKQKIDEEKTYLEVKHQAKNAFKKIPLDLIRVGSSGPSKLHWNGKDFQLYFKHPKRQAPLTPTQIKNGSFFLEIFSLKNRPILCRERKSPAIDSCSSITQQKNFSYVCYYKIGVPEPPTIVEMESELKTLPDEDLIVDKYYTESRSKSSGNTFLIVVIVIIVIIIVIGIIISYCYCQSEESEEKDGVRRTDSGSSVR